MTDSVRSFSRTRRRLTIVGIYASYPLIVAATFHHEAQWAGLPALTALIFLTASWAGVFLFMRMGRFWLLGNAPDGQLDEREVQMRLRAYHASYVTLVSLVFAGLVLWSLGVDLIDPLQLDYVRISALIWGLFLYGLTLPTAMIAWMERDDTE